MDYITESLYNIGTIYLDSSVCLFLTTNESLLAKLRGATVFKEDSEVQSYVEIFTETKGDS